MSAKFQYGGQAVIEGVMMRGRNGYAISVRQPDGTLTTDEIRHDSVTKKSPILNWPLVRGCVALFEALIIGIKALTYSANKSLGEDSDEQLTTGEIILTLLLAIGLAAVLFMALPAAVSHLTINLVPNPLLQNLIEGALRIAVFLLYVWAIAQMKDIKRVFRYHGAEHKVIHAYEHGEDLSAENIAGIQAYPTLHPRCGTSFLLIVMVVSILIFACLGKQVLWWRILSRILLLPVVAGVAYEVLKFSARHYESPGWQWLIKPGLWLQKLTTAQPDDSMIEAAMASLIAVLKRDGVWKEADIRSAENNEAIINADASEETEKAASFAGAAY